MLIIDDLGSTEMLVVLMRSHMDLQSLQAPCLTFTLIVIQAFCFFFPLQVPVVPSHSVRDSWVLSLVQTGSRFPLQGRVLPVGVCHPTSGNLLSGSSISPGTSLFLAPSTFGGKASVWWEWRQWCLYNSCTRIFQNASRTA